MSKNIKWALGIVAAVIVVAAVVLYPKLVVTLPNDGANAKPVTERATRGQRYTEMFLIGGNAITKTFEGQCLQHLGLNGGTPAGIRAPPRCWTRSTSRRWRSSSGSLAVYKNGPRLWTLDWIEASGQGSSISTA